MKTKFAWLVAIGFFVATGACAAPDPVSVMDLVHRSQEAAQLDQMESALDLARQATELDAAYVGAWKQLGSLLLQAKKYDQALEPLRIAVSLDPKNTSVLRDLSTAQWRAGQTNAALDSLRGACDLEPLNAKWSRDLATWYQASGLSDKAVEAFRRTLELNPADWASWRDLGWTLWSLGRREEALEAMDKAIAGGVAGRRDVELQVVAQLLEDKQVDLALASLTRWEPDARLLDLAISLVEKGRHQAATPLLLESWNRKEDPLKTGLYLAYIQSMGGSQKNIPVYLAPFLESLSAKSDAQQIGMALDASTIPRKRSTPPPLPLRWMTSWAKPIARIPGSSTSSKRPPDA